MSGKSGNGTSRGNASSATDRIDYECKLCGETFVGDRFSPDHPATECDEHEDGQHVWAEESDSYV